jgi:hypothetical protein
MIRDVTANASLVDLPNRRVVRRAPSPVGLIGAAFG